jgi:hypothetical protein
MTRKPSSFGTNVVNVVMPSRTGVSRSSARLADMGLLRSRGVGPVVVRPVLRSLIPRSRVLDRTG